MTETVPGTGDTPTLSRSVQAQLGQRLRHFYETLTVCETPLPERFDDILHRLREVMPEKN